MLLRGIHFSTFNVRNISQTGKLDQLLRGAQNLPLNITSMQAHRWITKETVSQYWNDYREFMFIYSSASQPRVVGVGLLFRSKFANSYRAAESSGTNSERIRNEVYFEGTQHVLVYVIYSSTDVVNDSDKKAFFKDLHESLSKEEPHSVDVVLGDFNGRTGLDSHQQNSQIIGRYTYHDSTKNEGKRLVDLFSQTRIHPFSSVPSASR